MRPEETANWNRLDAYLTQWAAWMRQPDLDIGYPKHASPKLITRSQINCYDDLAEECDGNAIQTVNALIGSLPGPESCSIHVYHLGSAWRFPDEPLEICYENARDSLEMGLNRWGLP